MRPETAGAHTPYREQISDQKENGQGSMTNPVPSEYEQRKSAPRRDKEAFEPRVIGPARPAEEPRGEKQQGKDNHSPSEIGGDVKKAIANDKQNKSCQTGQNVSSAGNESASHVWSALFITSVRVESLRSSRRV
jgi:hypothetical protein